MWNLGSALCRSLGGQLLHLAATTHGWPAGEEFPTDEDWARTHRVHGQALLAYDAGDADRAAAARAALHWVADHLGQLWD